MCLVGSSVLPQVGIWAGWIVVAQGPGAWESLLSGAEWQFASSCLSGYHNFGDRGPWSFWPEFQAVALISVLHFWGILFNICHGACLPFLSICSNSLLLRIKMVMCSFFKKMASSQCSTVCPHSLCHGSLLGRVGLFWEMVAADSDIYCHYVLCLAVSWGR